MTMNSPPTNAPPCARARKKFMYIHRRAPHGSNYAHEGLEVALMGAAFAQQVTLVFLDDGVFQLKKNQYTEQIEIKNFTTAFGALSDYEIKKILVEQESLQQRGLTTEDLMPLVYADDNGTEQQLIHIVAQDTLADLIAQQDVLLNF